MTILGKRRGGSSVDTTAPGPSGAPAEPGGAPRPVQRPLAAAAGPSDKAEAAATSAPAPPPRTRTRTRTRQEQWERRLFSSVLTLAFLVLVAAIALAFTFGTEQSGLPSATTTASAHAGQAAGPVPRPAHPPRARRVTRRAASSASLPELGGTAPVVTSLSPSKGGPGQAVTVSGAHFMSADGQIVADVAGVAAATDCPVQTSCTVVVPTLPGAPRSVRLTISSEAGTSSGVTFAYR
jgi:hypothetical protein